MELIYAFCDATTNITLINTTTINTTKTKTTTKTPSTTTTIKTVLNLQSLSNELRRDSPSPVVWMASQGEHVEDLVHVRVVTKNVG
jgi:hypothetical protein